MKEWIVLDIDDTVTDFVSEGYRACNAATGQNLRAEDCSYYFVHQHFGLTTERFHEILQAENSYDRLVPTRGLVEALTLAREKGFGVMFLTARGVVPNGRELTERWLERYEIPYDNLTCCTFKESKNDFLPVRTRFVAEDNANHLRGMALPTYRFLIHKPWNVNEQMPPDVRRINMKALPWQITQFAKGLL